MQSKICDLKQAFQYTNLKKHGKKCDFISLEEVLPESNSESNMFIRKSCKICTKSYQWAGSGAYWG